MIRNGPKIRLSSAPGRRRTSVTSLPTKAVVRVQLLSGPSRNSLMLIRSRRLCALAIGGLIGALHQSGKDFVKRWSVLAARFDIAARCLDGFEHARQCGGGVVGDDQNFARGALADVPHAGYVLEEHSVE